MLLKILKVQLLQTIESLRFFDKKNKFLTFKGIAGLKVTKQPHIVKSQH